MGLASGLNSTSSCTPRRHPNSGLKSSLNSVHNSRHACCKCRSTRSDRGIASSRWSVLSNVASENSSRSFQGNPHGFNSILTKQIQIGNFGHKKRNWVWLADITVLGFGGISSKDRQGMLTCRMVTPLSLLKFRLAQLCPDASRNEISTGGSV